MKGATKRRFVKGLEEKSSLQILHEAAQAGWFPLMEETVTEYQRTGPDQWVVVLSITGYPPGVGIGDSMLAARRMAGDRLLKHVRPVIHVCPVNGREFFPNEHAARRAIDQQQMLGVGKPWVTFFKCDCGGWHASGTGAKHLKKIMRAARSRSRFPWNAKPRAWEIQEAPGGEKVAMVVAELGLNAPDDHMGQQIALIIRRTMLEELMTALNEAEPPMRPEGDPQKTDGHTTTGSLLLRG